MEATMEQTTQDRDYNIPLASVVVITYNPAKFVIETLENWQISTCTC